LVVINARRAVFKDCEIGIANPLSLPARGAEVSDGYDLIQKTQPDDLG
jgi:hypothetical protein